MADIINMNKGNKEIPTYYSNVFTLTTGPYDFTFSFGYKTPKQVQEGSQDYDTVAYVSMSPNQAKTVIVILKEMIQRYEKEFGQIPLEKQFKDRYNKLFGK